MTLQIVLITVIQLQVTNIFSDELKLHQKSRAQAEDGSVTCADEVKIPLSAVSCTKNMAPDFYSIFLVLDERQHFVNCFTK